MNLCLISGHKHFGRDKRNEKCFGEIPPYEFVNEMNFGEILNSAIAEFGFSVLLESADHLGLESRVRFLLQQPRIDL